MILHPHHQAAVDRVITHFQAQPNVRALLLAGSIAHGFASEASDVDVMILVSDAEHQERIARQDTLFFSMELAAYPDGYIDGKYISEGFLAQVAEKGSEPARFAFADSCILFSQVDGLADQLARVTRYPVEDKINRITHFNAQFEAWRWFIGEAEKKRNPYLMTTAISKLLLFSGRMILAHNEMLYPFYKWLLAVLDHAPHKPDDLVLRMRQLSAEPNYTDAIRFYDSIKSFREWETDGIFWSQHFMQDSELTWMRDAVAIEDM